MGRRNRAPHQRTTPISNRTGLVEVVLLDGRKIRFNLAGQPRPFVEFLVPPPKALPGTQAGRTVLCRRVDAERYVEMNHEDLVKAGFVKDPDRSGDDLDRKPSLLL